MDGASFGAAAIQEVVKLTLEQAWAIWTAYCDHADYIKGFATFTKHIYDVLNVIGGSLPPHAGPVLVELTRWLRDARECLTTAVSHKNQAGRIWHARSEQQQMSMYRSRIMELLVPLLLCGVGQGANMLQLFDLARADAEEHFQGIEQQLAAIRSKLNVIIQGEGLLEVKTAVWQFQEYMSQLPSNVSMEVCAAVKKAVGEHDSRLEPIIEQFQVDIDILGRQLLLNQGDMMGNQDEMMIMMRRIEELLEGKIVFSPAALRDQLPTIAAEVTDEAESSGHTASDAEIAEAVITAVEENTLQVTGCRILKQPFTSAGGFRPVKMPCCHFTVSYLGAKTLYREGCCRFCSRSLQLYQVGNSDDDITVTEDEASQAAVAAEQMGLKPRVAQERDIEVGDFIGAGGEGQVFEGRYKGNAVAIKQIRWRVGRRNAEEIEEAKRMSDSLSAMVKAAYLASISSSNVCKMLAVRWTRDQLWILMELCEQTLEQFVEDAHNRIQRTGLHSVDVIALGLSLVDALEGLHHRARLLHLDVKPANILIPALCQSSMDAPRRIKRTIKLGDFGLATQLPTCVKTSMITDQGYSGVRPVGHGAIGYAPTEQLYKKVSRRTDVYSVGAVLKYAATGVHPYRENGAGDEMAAKEVLAGNQMEVPDSVQPNELRLVILKATKPASEDRPSLRVLRHELQLALRSIPEAEFLKGEFELPSMQLFLDSSAVHRSASPNAGR